ncbi:nucleotide-diphospho-sugar transferase [Ochromonadaceae sp. CCMP2298]|nr:nucleotide-diphospho-sugar transferase [Ochromonadaceae sp. CCMP2298]
MTKRALGEDSNAADGNKGSTASVWQKCFSKTYSRDYWFNRTTGEKLWDDPSVNSASGEAVEKGAKRPRQEEVKSSSSAARETTPHTKVAIVVPFRDLHAEQERGKHLLEFIPFMTKFLASAGACFHIYIVEQSDDSRKFNRGKLLNIGYDLAKKDNCNVFIFHDVDLLPSDELKSCYTQRPEKHPVHIARVWSRYNDNPRYFGGVVSFSDDMFSSINGFPNNFWGWGGEDDEMYNRTLRVGLTPTAPTAGSMRDMEKMGIHKKMAFLKANRVLKCMNKTEVLQEHVQTWKSNGLSNLHYTEISREAPNDTCTKVTVDVELNRGHWTDDRSGIADPQMD